jgi:gliding motility-associated-like protein
MDYTTNPFEGNQCAAIDTDFNGGANNDWLISPQIVLNGNQRLRYRYRVQSAGEPNEFRVMLSTTGNAPASFTTTLVPLATYSNTTYVERIVPLTGISGNANIGFHVPSGTLDGWIIYIDKFIIENIPTCLPSINLTVADISSTSAVLGWTDTNTTSTSQWEIIYVPQGSPEPLPTDTGIIVYTNPVLLTGLTPGTPYTYYVRAVCSSTDKSEWSTGANFTTLIINDNCDGAVFAPVNSSMQCQQVTPGTITGATATITPPIAPCIGTADDDVWFQFIASNTYLNIALLDVQGQTNLNFAVYSGQCGTLTQVFCSTSNLLSGVLNNLVIGQTYFIRVYSNANTPQTATFNLCITTPSTCTNSNTICNLLGENTPNTTGVASLGAIGCLLTSPNPTFYALEVATTGPINLFMSQNELPNGQGAGIDIDYAAWGPFTSQTQACSVVGNQFPFSTPGIGVPVTLQTGCSYSVASTETLNIANAQAGQIYIILITNYTSTLPGTPGFINLVQTNFGQPGAGTVNCCPEAFFQYQPSSYCKTPGNPNPIAVITPGSLAGVFSSPYTPGLVFANTATGEIDLMASAPGNYVIVNTIPATVTCQSKQRTYTINISEPTSATISYSNSSYCKNVTTLQAVTQTGTTGGSYSAIPNVGLSINPTTGMINPSLSSPGIYNVVYGLPGSICTAGNPSTQVEIIGVPNIPQPAAVSVCNTYTLPVLSVGSYYSQSGGLGIPIDITVPITSPQTIYVYANNNGCTNEKSFTVTINAAPIPILNVTQPTCAIPTGTIEVTSPLNGSGSGLPASLFISEVTDAPNGLGALTYVEIYNGTGSPVDLSNYKLNTYNNGSATVNSSCDNTLSGIINNNSTVVIAIGSASNQGGITPNLVFSGCSGVNNNDNIRLTKVDTGLDIDLWGDTAGVSFTPLGQPGYTYRRLPTATVPSLTWNPADWFIIDDVATVVDYSNIGQHTLSASNYEYSLDNGTYQSGTTFAGVAPGNHTITVHDLVTGCYSNPEPVTINAVTLSPTVLGFSYTTPVCKNSTTNPTPITDSGFTTGGEFSATPAGLIIDANSGLINLATSAPGAYTVSYKVNPNNSICLAGGTSTASITIKSMVTLGTNISYASPFCFGGSNPLPNTSSIGFTSGGIYSSTTGLNINPNTGEIDLGNSSAGSYSITYTVIANAANCELTTPSTTTVVITAPVQINVESGCQSNNYILTAIPIDNSFNPETATYTWRNGSGQVVGTNTQSITVTETGSYTVTVTTNGCSSVSLPVSVDSINCVIQKGISVNNDGKNDTFDLSGFNVKKLTIFNRYGLKVYDKNDYTNEWGGQSNTGDELPDGTYYYVIARDNGQNKSGWIYINRAQ